MLRPYMARLKISLQHNCMRQFPRTLRNSLNQTSTYTTPTQAGSAFQNRSSGRTHCWCKELGSSLQLAPANKVAPPASVPLEISLRAPRKLRWPFLTGCADKCLRLLTNFHDSPHSN